MAMQLIRTFRLPTLKVELDLSNRSTSVVTALSAYPSDASTQRVWWQSRFPLAAFGLGKGQPTQLTVPNKLVDELHRAFPAQVVDGNTLWLRLVPPYGYLGAAPWESAVRRATNRALLRVPDRLPAPAELGRVWRTVVVVNTSSGSRWRAAEYVDAFTRALESKIAGPVEVDVFADARTAAALQKRPASNGVRVHAPHDAKAAAVERASYTTSSGRQLWTNWIAAGLRGQAVRAVHVILDGAFDGDRPMLTLQPDPAESVPASKREYITADDVLAFADTLGADVLSFGSAPNNPADLATRMIADGLGQRRAGATLYSDISADRDGAELAAAQTFISDRNSGTGLFENNSAPPRDTLFAYLQPEYVYGALNLDVRLGSLESVEFESLHTDEAMTSVRSLAPTDLASNALLENIYRDADSVPSWVATSDRYLSSQWAGLARQLDSPVPTAEMKGAYNTGAAEALDQLRSIVDRHAEPS